MNFWWYIIIGEAAAILIFIILAMRKKWRIDHGTGDDPVEHYTEKRDELSGLEKEDVEDKEPRRGVNPTNLLSPIISLVIAGLIFTQILNTVTPIMNEQMNTTGVNPAYVTIFNGMTGLLPIIAIVGFAFVILSAFGLRGGSSSSDDYDDEALPKKKNPRKKGIEHYTVARDKMSKGGK